jgi:ribose transport system permease protein
MDAQSPAVARAGGLRRIGGIEGLRKLFPILLLAALCIVFSVLNPQFLSGQNLATILQQSVTILVVALGMTFVIIAGSIDLSVGSIVGLATVTAAACSGSMGIAAAIPASLVGLVAGAINGLIIAKGKVPSFIVTLGTMVIYRGIILLYTSGATIPIDDEGFVDAFAARTLGIPNSVYVALVLLAITFAILNFTVFGREVRAVGGGERVSVLTGIRVDRAKILMFVLMGVLCGMAGVLHGAWSMAATAQVGEGLELDVIAAVVVGGTPLTGGMGSVQRTVLGSLIIVILSNGMNMIGVDPYLQNIVKGAVLIAAVFVTIDRKKIGVIK